MSTKHKPSILDTEKLNKATKKKFAIVCSEWNSEIIDRLLSGAYTFFKSIDISFVICLPPTGKTLKYNILLSSKTVIELFP